jgi:hypothetical protein
MSVLKVLHLPTSVGGNSYGLSRAERNLGLKSDVLTCDKSYLDYPADIFFDFNDLHKCNNKIPYYLKKIKKRLLKKDYNVFQYNFDNYMNKINKKYNIIHFNFGTSLYGDDGQGNDFIDFDYYDKKKKFFVTYNGCDCRQKYKIINKYEISACANPLCYDGVCSSEGLDLKKQRKIKKMTDFCDGVFYLNPDLKQFLPDNSMFLPYSIASWDKITKQEREYKYPLKIVHAPSQRGAKGTNYILDIMEKVKNDYPNKIEFILIEGMKNTDAIKIYEQADILIDQILVGWYGALAVEAMKAGCTVMVYIRESDLKNIPIEMHNDIKNSFINCNQYNLYEKIAEIIENPDLLYKKSKYCYEYVNTWHNPEYVASITKNVYENY